MTYIMKRYFIYDKNTLSFKKAKPLHLLYQGIICVLLFVCFILLMGYLNKTKQIKNTTKEKRKISNINYLSSKNFLYPKENDVWEDSVFNAYAKNAQLFLDMPSNKGTPLKGDMMALAARNAYDSTGILLPLELALSQAVWESSLGRKGRSPKNNPYNVGERDSGTTKWYNSTFEGVQEYYYWMCRNYLSCKTLNQLFADFTNCNNKRYASNENYETLIRNTYYNIKKWIKKNKHKIK